MSISCNRKNLLEFYLLMRAVDYDISALLEATVSVSEKNSLAKLFPGESNKGQYYLENHNSQVGTRSNLISTSIWVRLI